MRSVVFKKKLISKNLNKGEICFKANAKIESVLKTNGLVKVAKKANFIFCQLVKKKQGNKKFMATYFNQTNIAYLYKTNNITKTKTKNCFWLKPKQSKFLGFLYLLIIGCFIGFINGFWGGGGGMVCVPTLTNLLKVENKKAHATTILIMLPLSVASFVVYLIKGNILWIPAGVITTGFVAGGVAGAMFLKKINNTILKIVFSLIIILGAIKMLI